MLVLNVDREIARAILDVTIATVGGVVAVSVLLPVYAVVALAKTVVNGFRPTTRRVPG